MMNKRIKSIFCSSLSKERIGFSFVLFVACFNFSFASINNLSTEHEKKELEIVSDQVDSSASFVGIYIQEGAMIFNREQIYVADSPNSKKSQEKKLSSPKIFAKKETTTKKKEVVSPEKSKTDFSFKTQPYPSDHFFTTGGGKSMVILPITQEYKYQSATVIISKNTSLYSILEGDCRTVQSYPSFFIQNTSGGTFSIRPPPIS